MTTFNFKQHLDRIEIFVPGGCKAWPDVGRFRRLAFHLVMNGLTEPQNFEGITIGAFSFILNAHDSAALARSLATSNIVAGELRDREAAVRAT